MFDPSSFDSSAFDPSAFDGLDETVVPPVPGTSWTPEGAATDTWSSETPL